jgi:hypothetical protein
MKKHIALALVASLFAVDAAADPCGMVPPVWEGQGSPITRVGPQRTYVFFKDGVETFVIRPGFQGNVDNFGMLIPFPSVPSIRKVSESTFPQIVNAVSPPPVTIDLRPPPPMPSVAMRGAGGAPSAVKSGAAPLRVDEVRVVKQEAVGMYEIAVLEAGSPKALNRWMDDHGYKYPKGMDGVVLDYVKDRWVFVAVKTRVGVKSRVSPKPGMRRANPKMKKGGTFDGHVQAMGFRFKVKSPVIPMRLSSFNEGELYNEVFFLGEQGVKLRSLPSSLVAEQVEGGKLFENVTDLLPLRVIHSKDERKTLRMVNMQRLKSMKHQRNPEPHNGVARDLFVSDLVAVKTGQLALKFEETEKQLLNISERLNLRGAQIDVLMDGELKDKRKKVLAASYEGLREMTLTVIKGDLPRGFIAKNNLRVQPYRWKGSRKTAEAKPAPSGIGSLGFGWGWGPPNWKVPVVDRAYAKKLAKKWPELKYWASDEVWSQ